MHARSFALAHLLRSLTAPLAIALPPLFWVAEATRRDSVTPLGGDQGIFQYVAWALGHGAVDYRDLRDVNGPLTHIVHMVLLALGGADEHRFRILDLTVTGVTFALVGSCVPGLRSRRAPAALDRIGWALAGWVVLSGQYLLYGYWDLAQRESFFDWFMLPSVGLQLVAQAPWCGAQSRARAPQIPLLATQARLLAVVGALSVAPWLGKPTYAIFTFAQLLALLSDREMRLPRSKALLAFGVGGALGAALPLAFLVSFGDTRPFARIQLTDVPTMYRFICPRALADLFSTPWRATQAIFALVGGVGLLALVLLGEMPPRTIVLALVPVCALVSVAAQGKG